MEDIMDKVEIISLTAILSQKLPHTNIFLLRDEANSPAIVTSIPKQSILFDKNLRDFIAIEVIEDIGDNALMQSVHSLALGNYAKTWLLIHIPDSIINSNYLFEDKQDLYTENIHKGDIIWPEFSDNRAINIGMHIMVMQCLQVQGV